MASHSCILAWKMRWTEEPGGLQSMGSQRVDTIEQLYTHTHTGHMCPALKDTANQFSKVVVPMRILGAVLKSLD